MSFYYLSRETDTLRNYLIDDVPDGSGRGILDQLKGACCARELAEVRHRVITDGMQAIATELKRRGFRVLLDPDAVTAVKASSAEALESAGLVEIPTILLDDQTLVLRVLCELRAPINGRLVSGFRCEIIRPQVAVSDVYVYPGKLSKTVDIYAILYGTVSL